MQFLTEKRDGFFWMKKESSHFLNVSVAKRMKTYYNNEEKRV